MARVNKDHILKRIREEGYTIEVLDDNENVKSSKYVPPLTQEERAIRGSYKAIDKIKQNDGNTQTYTPEEIIKLLEISGIIKKANDSNHYVYI